MSPRVFDSVDALSEAAAAHIAEKIREHDGPFHLALSGGSTPKKLYAILASAAYRESVDWSQVHFWFGDERFVPPSDEQSNERMARETLLNHVGGTVHPMYREGTPDEAARAYEADLKETLGTRPLDLVLLGIGPDGHTASLFPGDPSVHEQVRAVVPSTGAAGERQRLTLTTPVINGAHEVLFLIAGDDKAEPLKAILEGEYEPDRYPAQVVARNAPNAVWFVDQKAASQL